MSKIWGIGTDIVQISRIRKTYENFGMRFLKRAYNPIEIAKFQSKSINQFNYLASRYFFRIYLLDGQLKKQYIKQ